MTKAELWQDRVGLSPHAVIVYENAEKGGTIYLRWRSGGNWKKRSLGASLRDERGRVKSELRRMALAEAERQYELLSGKRAPASATKAPLTLAATWPIISHAKTGLYPTLTPHAKEVAMALRDAGRILGDTTPWDLIDRARIRGLGRTRIDDLRAKKTTGYRGAEVTLQRLFAIAAWLRDEGLIATDACLPPRKWRDDLRSYWQQVAGVAASPEPTRPRHTLPEMRRILEKAGSVDPRLELLLALGAELRLGQVLRARRSDLSVEHRTLTIRGARKKRGTVVELTAGQWAAWERARDGYLAKLEEALPDYPLFPRGQMPGGRSGHPVAEVARHGDAPHIDRNSVINWFHLAETKAKVPYVRGRSAYGLRRVAVDAAKEMGISREGLKAHGGWTDSAVPDAIYAEQDAGYARTEARDVRARIRGEAP